ncbi:hypothetical protein JTE90_005861 [Oedothorax gibbosus]|uniref:LEM domain-containing protein n=1 Tax=Oedothorax gibbosus TaxID=931172 RepID=A0AAV6UQ98_9ARAC|nr:hypothetical protein JTE90_005861 [Oedothorax gibbosus]
MENSSDEDLRKLLKAYGQDVGPINNSTRPYWKKALSKLTIQHVSPITSTSKKGTREKKLISENKKFVASPTKSLIYISKCTDRSFSEEDLSDSENDSVVMDSPGSTPFPAKTQRIKKSPLIKNTKTSPVETLAIYANRKNCHHSTTPSSTRNPKVKCFDGKSIEIQQKDRELRKKFKEYGKSLLRSPMNDAMIEQWRKRQNKLQCHLPEKNIYDFEDCQDEFETEYEFDAPRPSDKHIKKNMITLFTLLLKGIVCAIIIIIGIFLMLSSEDIKRIEESLD